MWTFLGSDRAGGRNPRSQVGQGLSDGTLSIPLMPVEARPTGLNLGAAGGRYRGRLPGHPPNTNENMRSDR
jgi:hypothetical protein